MGLLGLVMPPAEAAALLLVPSLVTNIWQLLAGPRCGAILQRLRGTMIGVCVGTWAGSGLIAGHEAEAASTALGAALVVYAALGLAKLRLIVPPAAEPWAGPVAGIATGLVTGATGVFVIPAVPYLAALGFCARRHGAGAGAVVHRIHPRPCGRSGLACGVACPGCGC
jgi:uncharacterized membrane protein YfcA